MGDRVLPIWRGAVVVSLVLASLFLFGPGAQAIARFRAFAVPTTGSLPQGIAAGPDGNLWFTEKGGDKIGRITTAGAITEFTIPSPSSNPTAITAGPDGNLWFTEYSGNEIGRITTAGAITEFTIPSPSSNPTAITAGPDGNLWFTEYSGNKIGRITTDGTVTGEFLIPTVNSYPDGITPGPDGNLWFTEDLGDKIGQISTAGPSGNHIRGRESLRSGSRPGRTGTYGSRSTTGMPSPSSGFCKVGIRRARRDWQRRPS